MEGDFELPVSYNGRDYLFQGRFTRFGYSYRVELDVEGYVVYFERDEERDWRAIVDPEKQQQNKSLDIGLFEAIVASLDKL